MGLAQYQVHSAYIPVSDQQSSRMGAISKFHDRQMNTCSHKLEGKCQLFCFYLLKFGNYTNSKHGNVKTLHTFCTKQELELKEKNYPPNNRSITCKLVHSLICYFLCCKWRTQKQIQFHWFIQHKKVIAILILSAQLIYLCPLTWWDIWVCFTCMWCLKLCKQGI